MGTSWDRAAAAYLEQWVPRFVPYHLDLVRETALRPASRVLVTSAGPGAEVLAVARVVGAQGYVRATDTSPEMVRICRDQVARARLATPIECAVEDAGDASGGPWDAIVCAFGLWQLTARVEVLRAWQAALAPRGKVAIITWGPGDADDPFTRLGACLRELEPDWGLPESRVDAERAALGAMFERAGLSMVRHTVVRHTLTFESAERFVGAMREACTWRRVWEGLGDARMQRVAKRFYEWSGGPDRVLSFDPAAAVAIAARPNADVELAHRVHPSDEPPVTS
jgi:SAM-dependent methyltransferase